MPLPRGITLTRVSVGADARRIDWTVGADDPPIGPWCYASVAFAKRMPPALLQASGLAYLLDMS